MTTPDFTTTLIVDGTPQQAYDAINNVRGWWSEEIEGSTDKLNEAFDYHFEDIHICKIKVIELVPSQKVVWEVLENYFKFTQDKTEWVGTTISFEISEQGDKTEVVFTHHGLVPEYECYEICRGAWTTYIQNSLASLISTGKGQPNAAGKAQTEDEAKLMAGKEQGPK